MERLMSRMSTKTGAVVLALSLLGSPAVSGAGWRTLEAGLELGEFSSNGPSVAGESTVVILRVDPALWDLRLFCTSAADTTGNLTAEG